MSTWSEVGAVAQVPRFHSRIGWNVPTCGAAAHVGSERPAKPGGGVSTHVASAPVVPSVVSGPELVLVVGATVALSVAVPASEPVDPPGVGDVDEPVGSVADEVCAPPV